MHLKRYLRQTVQDALRAVRDDMGPDALVLSTRVVPAPGPRGWLGQRVVEVTAAAGRPPLPADRQPDVEAREADAARRAALEMSARLRATGLDRDVAREVAEAHPQRQRRGASVRTLCGTLAEQLAPLVARDNAYAAVEVFVGPPGAGKTTTIAKIAAQERVKRGHRLGLIAADGFRVGAVEQLRLYAGLLGAPLAVARTAYELMTAIETATGPVLVDTAGRSPSDGPSGDMLRVVASRPGVRTHLVVPADTPPPTLRRIVERFAPARPVRLVLTRLDEAESLAPLVALLREWQIPVSYLANGQRVPDDLQEASPRALAAWVAGDAAGHGSARRGTSSSIHRGFEPAGCVPPATVEVPECV